MTTPCTEYQDILDELSELAMLIGPEEDFDPFEVWTLADMHDIILMEAEQWMKGTED